MSTFDPKSEAGAFVGAYVTTFQGDAKRAIAALLERAVSETRRADVAIARGFTVPGGARTPGLIADAIADSFAPTPPEAPRACPTCGLHKGSNAANCGDAFHEPLAPPEARPRGGKR